MAELNYPYIAALVKKADVSGASIYCEFECPVTGVIITSTAPIQKKSAGILNNPLMQDAQSSIMLKIRRVIGRFIAQILGHNQVQRSATILLNQTLQSAADKAEENQMSNFSESEKESAVVQAFIKVQNRFVWEEKNQRWISVEAEQMSE